MKNGFHVFSSMFTKFARVNVFAFILFALLASSSAWAAGGTMSGSGTETDPFLIEDEDDWNAFATSVNSGKQFVKLVADISVSQKVGDYSQKIAFWGTFDGGGHTITANIYGQYGQYTALFSYIWTATIKNLVLKGTISGYTGSGLTAGLVAYAGGGNRIENCTVSATISGGSLVGGILGDGEKNNNIDIENCVFSGKLVGGYNAKGVFLVSYNSRDKGVKYVWTVKNCLYIQQEGQDTYRLDIVFWSDDGYGSVEMADCFKTANVGSYGTLAYLDLPANALFYEKMADKTKFYVIADIAGLLAYYPYTQKDIEPSYVITDNNGRKLIKGTDFIETIEPLPVNALGDYTLTLDAVPGSGFLGKKVFNFFVVDELLLDASNTKLTSGIYKVRDNVTIDKRITIVGDVTLVLDEGVTLNASNGIDVSMGNSLTIEGKGTLNATGNSKPGIGANYVGTIVINGGIVNASGSAGIGGGNGGEGGSITINGGTITANRIGGSETGVCGTIVVNGGKISATGSDVVIGQGSYSLENSCTLTLGWTNDDDFIYARGYGNFKNISFAEGKRFYYVDGGKHVEVSLDNIKNANSKTIYPLKIYKITQEEGSACIYGNYMTSCGIPTEAGEGDVVTFSLVPAERYVLDTVRVYDETARKYLTVTDGKWYDNTASFVMPASDIRVDVRTRSPSSDLYVNMPATGTKKITLPSRMRSFWVYDDGGKNQNYSNNASGTLQLVAPEGHSFGINVKYLNTESGKDKLTVYDGINSTNKLYDGISGDRVETKPFSTGNSIKIFFESNGSTNKSGFEIQIDVEDRGLAGSGTEADPFVIDSENDWDWFRTNVRAGNSYAGQFVRLDADIAVSGMVGSVDKGMAFSGTFDGKGKDGKMHTVTANISDTHSGTALFQYISGATIKNLTVAGSIVGDIHAAGLVGYSNGTGSKIENCVVSATVEGSSHIGGILGHGGQSDITIDNCVFRGKLVGGTSAMGVFFGWGDNGGTKVVKNCLYIPDSKQTFTNLDLVKMDAGSVTVTDCYKTENVGTYGTLVYLEKPENVVVAEKIAADGTRFYVISNLSMDDDGYYVNMPANGTQIINIPSEVPMFKLYDDGGKNRNYSNNASGMLHLVAPAGYIFWVSGSANIRDDDKCIVYDGEMDASGTMDCSSQRDIDFATSGNIMTVLLTSNESRYADGLDLTVWVVKKNEEHRVTCSAVDDGGTLECSRTSAKYGENVYCTYESSPKEGSYFYGFKVSGENYEKVVDWYSSKFDYKTFKMPYIDVTVTPVFTDKPEVFVNMPKIDYLYIPLGVTQFYVYDDGGKNENYSNNVSEKFEFYAPEGYFLRLTGNVDLNSNNVGDTLKIYDGDYYDGDYYYYDKNLIKEIVSSVNGIELFSDNYNYMTITFKSDGSYTSKGFDFTVDVVKNDFSVNCLDKLDGGTLSCSKKNAQYGESIELNVKPDKGYGSYGVVISGVSLSGKNEEETIFFDGLYSEEKTVSFDMPRNDVTVTPVYAKMLPGDGSVENPYVISSASEWDIFASSVDDGFTYENKFVKLSANIEVSKKVGDYNQGKFFSGTFDGDGHTITANITDKENRGTSLFGYLFDATIKNLTVAGNIIGGRYPAGLAGIGWSNVKIENCVVSATILGDTEVGGILGYGLSGIAIDNCVFNGKLVGYYNTTGLGAFIGKIDSYYSDNVVSNSLYILQENQNTDNLDLVQSYSDKTYVTMSDCYKTADVGAYGSRAYLSKPANMNSIEMTAVDNTKFYVPDPMDNGYINVPFSGTKNIAIPSGVTSFKVYDNGGKDGDRSNDADGTLLLVAPDGYVVQVTGSANSSDDMLMVYDGGIDGKELLNKKGSIDGINLFSAGNSVAIRYDTYSRCYATANCSGLDLTVTLLANTMEEHTVTCVNQVEGGALSCGKTRAKNGDAVAVNAAPAEGRYFYGVKLTGENYEKFIDDAWFSGLFTMPPFDVTVTPMFTEQMEAYVNMPAIGTKNITVPPGVTSFKVYDDGGKDGNYSNNCDGYLVLTAPEGYVFRLDGKYVDDDYSDYLNVYDGKSSAAKQLVDKSDYYAVNLSRIYSTGRNITLYIHSGESYNGDGLDLTVSVVPLYTITYAERVDGSMAVAETGDKVEFTVNVPEGNYLIETIVKDEKGNLIEVDGGTWCDYAATFYNNGFVQRDYVGSFTMPSSNVTVTPVFTDKPTVEGGLYVKMPTIGSKQAMFPRDVISFKVYDDGGKEGTYSNGSKGTLYLSYEQSGDAFELSGTVNLGSGEDYFIAYDKMNDDSPIMDKIMGTATVPTVHCCNYKMKLYFESDNDGNGAGLDLTVKKIPVKRSIIYADGISGDKDEAARGEVVTMKVTPPEGQVLDSITVVRHFDNGNIDEFDEFDMEEYVTGGTWYSDNMATLTVQRHYKNFYYTVTPVFKLPTAVADLYVEMPQNVGTKNVNIPPEVQSFKVYEFRHYGDISYHIDRCIGDHDNCERYLVLTAPEGHALQMEGTAKLHDNYDTDLRDYVYIYDGDVSAENTLLKHRYNEGDVPLIYSSGRTLILYSNAGYGFKTLDLTVTVIEVEQNRSVRCVEQIDGGSIACDKTLAKNGDVVTVEATPDVGRVFAGVLITGEDYEKTELTMTSTVSFTMPAVDVTVVPLFSDGYYVNMPAFGTKNVTVPPDVKTFKVYDDGGKFGNYSGMCDGYLTLTAPEGYVFQLSGEIGVQYGSEDIAGYFTVFDGTAVDEKLIERLNGGPRQIPVVYTDGKTVTLNLKSNTTNSHTSSGLDLTVNVIKPEYSITCADNINGGTIQCPKKSRAGEYITLNASPANGYVFQGVEIKDENQNTVEMSALVGNMTMFIMPISDVTVTPVFKKTDVAAIGLDFVNMPCRDTKTVELPPGLTTLKVYDDGGKDGFYSTNCEGILTLSAPDGYTLRMEGTADYSGYLNVYDGNSTMSYKLIDGSWDHWDNTLQQDVPSQVASSGSDLTLYFWTYSSFDYRAGEKDDDGMLVTSSYNRPGLDFTVTVVKNDESHSIVCNNADAGGTASCDKTSAKAGEKVTLTATPEQGYLYYGYQVSGTNSTGGFERTELADGWYSGEKSVAFGMVSSDVTVTPLFTDKHSAEEGLTVVLPTEGTQNVNIPEEVTSFKVVDDIHFDNRIGFLVLTAPVGYVLELSGTIRAYTYDYISAYDGTDTQKPLFDRVYGQYLGQCCGGGDPKNIPTVRSTGRNMILYYYMRYASGDEWLDLTVRVVKADKPGIITITEADGKKQASIDGEYEGTDVVNITEDIKVESVIFNRVFTPNSGYATIMLPFDVKATSLTGVRSVIEFDGVKPDKNGNNTVGMRYVWCNATLGEEEGKEHPERNCNKYSGELKAYTPYMIEMESATLGIKDAVTLKSNSGKIVGDAPVGNWVFRGTLQKKVWPKGTGIINEGRLWAFAAAERSGAKIGEFVQFGGNNWANPFRAYLVECKKTDNGLDCKDDAETQPKPSLVSRYRFADALAPTDSAEKSAGAAATDQPLVMRQAAASETASLNSMDIVIVYGDKDSEGDKERPTVIGRMNPATGEIRMLPRTKQTYDLKGRRVGNGKKAKGAYYRR